LLSADEKATAKRATAGAILEISDTDNGDNAGATASNGSEDPARVSFAGRAALLLRTKAQLQLGQTAPIKAAASDLQAWVSDHPDDALAWQRLAQTDRAQGLELRALRAEGEAHMVNLDYAGALDRWRAAQDYSRQHQSNADDLIQASIVNVRLRAAQQALKRQQKEEKEME
jgi:predicted Zn-dependent protease